MQHVDEAGNVRHVQSHGRFVKDVERAGGLDAACDVFGGLRFREFRDELDALCFTARECVRGLPELEVAESHVLHQLQRLHNGCLCTEKFDRLINRQLQYVAD